MQLAGDPGIARAEQPDVGYAFGQHEQPVKPHADGKPAVTGQPAGGQHAGMGEAAFPHLHPAAILADVDLAALKRVRMGPRLLTVGHARGERGWGRGVPPGPGVHLSEAVGLTRRSASRRPTLGREARKSPCQHVDHNQQANVPAVRRSSEIAGVRVCARQSHGRVLDS